jgi:tetratricopeptide (TPR) repeat protein
MELTVDQALQQAIAAHKEGRLQDAERLYRAILQAQPNNPDANHNLGILAVAVGKPLDAVPLFKQALKGNSKVEQYWRSHIDVLIRLERFDEAKRALVEGERSGVCSEKLDFLRQQTRVASLEDKKNIRQGLTLSEKPKKLAKKKKSKKRTAAGVSPSKSQINPLMEHFQAGRFAEA